jgi:outer membrane protein TolC
VGARSVSKIASGYSTQMQNNISIPMDLRYSAKLAIDLPLFQGLKNLGEHKRVGALYNQSRALVIEKTRDLEQKTRVACFNLYISAEELQIQNERVQIARARFDLAETKRDLGKIADYEYDNIRTQLFEVTDYYFNQQIQALQAQEALRALVRLF